MLNTFTNLIAESPPQKDGFYNVAGYYLNDDGSRAGRYVGSASYDADAKEWHDGECVGPAVEFVWWCDLPLHPDNASDITTTNPAE